MSPADKDELSFQAKALTCVALICIIAFVHIKTLDVRQNLEGQILQSHGEREIKREEHLSAVQPCGPCCGRL